MIRGIMSVAVSVISLLLLAAVFITIAINVTAVKNDVILVDLPGQGLIQGTTSNTAWTNQSFLQFLGIPFAEAPSGDLRFKPPVERAPWKHIHDATKYGQRCPVITSVTDMSKDQSHHDMEDCLNLCVYTKNLNKKVPVMFYIYGGGFYNGSASDHPPNYLLEKDIILVVTQYRVGAVGWLSTQTEEMPGNSPIFDIILALQWVQKYIHLFGGDTEQVTIFGQSAGAAVAGILVLSPKTPPGLFQRVILQSGSILAPWATNDNPLQKTKDICKKLTCINCADSAEIYKCLREKKIIDILKATSDDSFSLTVNDFHGIMPLNPFQLLNMYSSKYPIMTGVTKHDGSFVLATFYDTLKSLVGNMSLVPPREFSAKLFDVSKEPDLSGLGKNLMTAFLYNETDLDGSNHKNLIPAYIDQASNLIMKSPVLSFAKRMVTLKCTTFLYTFDYEGQWTRFGYEFGNEHYPFNGGAHHSNDNIYLYSTHKLNAVDTEVSKKMVDIWTSFAINGVPYTGNDPPILPLQNEAGPYFHIDKNISVGMDFFKELRAAVDDPNKENLIKPDIDF